MTGAAGEAWRMTRLQSLGPLSASLTPKDPAAHNLARRGLLLGGAGYTVDELLFAAVSNSDNTAADMLMRRIGGPGVVTAWLVAQRVFEVRVDRYERELQPEMFGMASFRPAWKGPGFAAAMATVP